MHNTTTITSSSDGAHTIKTDKFDTYYHSIHGAYTEADVVFIQAGLEYFINKNPDKKEIRIFEMGFGTGLNVLKTYLWSQSHDIDIDFHTIEAYPLDSKFARELNYGRDHNCQNLFESLHLCLWDEGHQLSDKFSFAKYKAMIEEFELPKEIDIVYYDAFAPDDQPELWRAPILSKYFNAMNPGAVLTTYCAQGEFRRQLLTSGFTVERIPGPNGKREMIRAMKV